jgi:signal transduction histidine kinase/ActR/RegA family two-component response regulator
MAMKQSVTIQFGPQQWSPRARLYGGALVITLSYLLIGRLNSGDQSWVEVNLPLSTVSILLLSIAAAETYLYVQRMQRYHAELEQARAHEQELSQRLAYQRQTILSQISGALINALDLNQMPREVMEKVAEFFQADLVATWVTDATAPGSFALKSVHGLTVHSREQLEPVRWSFPQFRNGSEKLQQFVLEEIGTEVSSAVATFCQREKLVSAVLSPIISRNELAGIVGVFWRKRTWVSPALAAEMQTVANVIAGALQAEELYRDLVQVQKIESIGTLTSGIAHDFNNVLAAILACTTYVKQQTNASHPTYRYLEATESSAHRGAALTKQLLAFARREGPRLSVVNANECIEQTLKMLDRSFEKTILIQRQFAKDLKPVEADASQLEQVILNIAVNARDAMGESGIFTITTRNARLDIADPYRPDLTLADGQYVVLGFRDTGSGMDAGTLNRIFEPFFTTKRVGKGTGLGLSLVQSIVKTFRGEIRVESALGKGTLFEVYLPATDKPLPATKPTTATAVRGGKECLLLAEDEEVIREMAQLSLESKGYKVIAASDGASALARYRESWHEIDLVIADMVMPRMNGPELFARMKEINPNVRVIVSSGYSHDQEGQRMLKHGCLGFIQKPYNPEALNQLVRSVLDSGL